MTEINLKQRMMEKPLGGVLIQFSDSPAVLYVAKQSGLDFVLYDCEHGIIPYEKLHDLMLCGNALDLPSIVRVPELSRAWVSRILDFGGSGVMVPMMESAEQARKLADWAKYPPLGRRSYSGGAHTGYASSGNHSFHMQEDNQRTIAIAQIETVEGIRKVADLCRKYGKGFGIIGSTSLLAQFAGSLNLMVSAIETHLWQESFAGCRRSYDTILEKH